MLSTESLDYAYQPTDDSIRAYGSLILEELRKMCIGELGPLADLLLLFLRLWFRGRHVLCIGSPLCSVGSRLHPILLQILFNIEHITR